MVVVVLSLLWILIRMDDADRCSLTSSMGDLTILDTADFTEITKVTPPIRIFESDPEHAGEPQLAVVVESDEEDLGAYLVASSSEPSESVLSEETSDVTADKSEASLDLDTTFGLLSPLSPDVFPSSPTESSSPDFYFDFDYERPSSSRFIRSHSSPSSTGETGRATSGKDKRKKRFSPEEVDPWKPMYSYALKEELRSKIHFQRFITGQPELKVEFPTPKPTISYDAVQKRHETREKNKMYAKLSRDKQRKERELIENENRRLVSERDGLRREIEKLKRKASDFDKFVSVHSKDCPFYSKQHSLLKVAKAPKIQEKESIPMADKSPKKKITTLSFKVFTNSPAPPSEKRIEESASTSDSEDVKFFSEKKGTGSASIIHSRSPAGSSSGALFHLAETKDRRRSKSLSGGKLISVIKLDTPQEKL